MKCLPLSKPEPRDLIRKQMTSPFKKDLLKERNGITPEEIRFEVIRAYLRALKQLFMNSVALYKERLELFMEDEKRRRRQQSLLKCFGGISMDRITRHKENRTQNNGNRRASFSRKRSDVSRRSSANLEKWIKPEPPHFRVILKKQALRQMISLANEHVENMRCMWQPSSRLVYEKEKMKHEIMKIGEQIATLQFKQIQLH